MEITIPETDATAITADSETTAESVIVKGEYNIGATGPAGGHIFYIDERNQFEWTYFEAAPSDFPVDNNRHYQWFSGVEDIETGATATAFGTGMSNTQKIVDIQGNGSSAAKLCSDLTQGGSSVWFLPSKDKLNEMYKNLHKKGIGSFEPDYYWSSSESGYMSITYDIYYAWFQDFYNGNQYDYKKDNNLRVRAVRAFN